jgi:hypothetical protein
MIRSATCAMRLARAGDREVRARPAAIFQCGQLASSRRRRWMLAAAASLAAVATHERVRGGTAADGKFAAHAEPLTAGRARAWDARRRQASRRGRRRTDRSGLHRRLPSCTRRAGRGPRRWTHARSARAPGSFDPPGRRPRAKRDRTMRELKPKGSMTPLASAGCKSDIVSNGLPTVDAFAVAKVR